MCTSLYGLTSYLWTLQTACRAEAQAPRCSRSTPPATHRPAEALEDIGDITGTSEVTQALRSLAAPSCRVADVLGSPPDAAWESATGSLLSLALALLATVASATVFQPGRGAAGAAWPAAKQHVQRQERGSGRPRRSALPPPRARASSFALFLRVQAGCRNILINVLTAASSGLDPLREPTHRRLGGEHRPTAPNPDAHAGAPHSSRALRRLGAEAHAAVQLLPGSSVSPSGPRAPGAELRGLAPISVLPVGAARLRSGPLPSSKEPPGVLHNSGGASRLRPAGPKGAFAGRGGGARTGTS
ncbi:hypothetical protein NDU88_000448 [Pleurodeles waltl]|uniref:Uncharacterized protein n=1 Tax=Pleurodeles waltl TaxID=8319 RepID=A0AAV7UU31_PLEWA|nr:hypothetical protein NDU88_000448 [Pleurodeles waltl]